MSGLTSPSTAAAPPVHAGTARGRFRASLRTRLVLASSLLLAVIVGLQSYLEIRIFETRAEADLRDAGALTAQAVSDDLELRGGLAAIDQISRSLHEFIVTVPTIRSISVIALDGSGTPQVRASTSSNELPAAIALAAGIAQGRVPEWQDGPGALASYALPVMRDDNTIEGAVVVTMSKAGLDELRTRGRLITLYLAPLAIVVMTMLLDQLARELIYRPLAGIQSTMRRTADGETRLRAPVVRHDELGALAEGLNQMLDRMEGFNQSLQERVAAATAELQARNAENVENYQRILSLREALARSEQLAAVGQTAASVAHQVGTPLNLVSGYVQLMLAERDLDPRVARRLHTVREQIDRVAAAVRGLLDRARPSSERRRVDVAALLARLRTIATPRLAGAGMRLNLRMQEPLPAVLAEETDLELALLNLITNAIDAMSSGGALTVTAAPDPAGVRVVVKDTGTGIAPDLLPLIFDPWVTTKPPSRGTGLGLSITREVVSRLGGSIDVRSAAGSGTEFTILLPAAPPDGEPTDGAHPRS